MILLHDRLSVKTLLSGQTSFLAMSSAFKRKDYNKITNRLRAYHAIASFLQTPPLSEIQQLHNIESSLRNLDHTLEEIQLSVDEMAEDTVAIGFNNFSEAFDGVAQIMKVLHEYLTKTVRQNIYFYHSDSIKPHRNVTNICNQCQLNHHVSHIKRIKTDFGMLYPDTRQDESSPEYIKRMQEKQDLALQEKEDFIGQINLLLQKKDKMMMTVPANARRYKDLVDCLSKMQQINNRLQDKQMDRKAGDGDSEDKLALQDNYKKILEEVKQILNNKFREGYSSRIQSMLGRFQIVLKEDKAKKTQRKIYVNSEDASVQTQIMIPEQIQIRLMTDELEKREAELVSLKQGRAKIETKYIKILESERHMSKDMLGFNLKMQKMENEINEKDRLIKYLTEEITKIGQHEFDAARMYQTLNLHDRSKVIESTRINKQKISSSNKFVIVKTSKAIEGVISQQTQTEANAEEELGQTQRGESKKKLIRLMKRRSSFNMDSFSMMKGKNDASQNQIPHKKQCLFSICSRTIQAVISSKTIQSQDNLNVELRQVLTAPLKPAKLKKRGIQKNKRKTQKGASNNQQHTQQISQRAEDEEETPQTLKKISGIERQKRTQKIPDITSHGVRSKDKKLSIAAQQQMQTNIKKQELRASRQFKNINFIRLTELPFSQPPRVRTENIDSSKGKEVPHHSNNKQKQKEGIVRINKYEKKDSSTMDRQKVREVLALLKIGRDNGLAKNFRNVDLGFDLLDVPKEREDGFSESKSFEGELNSSKPEDERSNSDACDLKINVAETIWQLKNLIETEYPYLKAMGLVDYLLVMDKKNSQVNRNLIKYKFQFTRINEADFKLFGGVEEMVLFSHGLGVWQRYIEEENDLKLYFKHINFAHKISKYFILLKKMNAEYFEEYTSFIVDPLAFSLVHFKQAVIDSVNSVTKTIDGPREKVADGHQRDNWKRIMMRLIRYHHEVHSNCQHIVEFLQKIGYYRYSM